MMETLVACLHAPFAHAHAHGNEDEDEDVDEYEYEYEYEDEDGDECSSVPPHEGIHKLHEREVVARGFLVALATARKRLMRWMNSSTWYLIR